MQKAFIYSTEQPIWMLLLARFFLFNAIAFSLINYVATFPSGFALLFEDCSNPFPGLRWSQVLFKSNEFSISIIAPLSSMLMLNQFARGSFCLFARTHRSRCPPPILPVSEWGLPTKIGLRLQTLRRPGPPDCHGNAPQSKAFEPILSTSDRIAQIRLKPCKIKSI